MKILFLKRKNKLFLMDIKFFNIIIMIIILKYDNKMINFT